MHKGHVVEEGDHESLMSLGGTYHSLVEQQNLRQAEEEEKLAFERRASAVMAENEENELNLFKKRASTTASITASTNLAMSDEKRNSVIDAGIVPENVDIKPEKVKINNLLI